jgi:6 kDa early secretory antigenic target
LSSLFKKVIHSLDLRSQELELMPKTICMTHFQVDSQQVLAANSAIQSTIGRLRSEIDTLHGQLQGLQASWQGVAANSFQELVTRWRTTESSVQDQLAQIGQALSLAATQYADVEAANLRLFA